MGAGISTSNNINGQKSHYYMDKSKAKDLFYPIKLELLLENSVNSNDIIDNSWSLEHKSQYISVNEENPKVAMRHPVSKSTDCIRGRKGYDNGFHVWEINWPGEYRGSNAVIGVSTSKGPIHSEKYEPLLGKTKESWGWDIGRCRLYHDTTDLNSNIVNYPYFLDDYSVLHYTVPNMFLLILDMDEGTLSFMANNQYLGVAFHGLKNLTLFPAASIVWGNAEVTLTYKGCIQARPLKLKELSRHTIRINLIECTVPIIYKLPLPKSIKQYLALDKTYNSSSKELTQ